MALGALMGWFGVIYAPFVGFFPTVFALFAAVLIQIILHEGGHMIMGLATGYRFISFRILSFAVVKDGSELRFKKYSLRGTAGQCLMLPPDNEIEKPYFLYNAGGVLFNIIFSAVFAIQAAFFPVSPFFGMLFSCSAVFGFYLAVTNGLPFIMEIPNDAKNICAIRKDPVSLTSFYHQLETVYLLSEGVRFKDMPQRLFEMPENADMTSPLNFAVRTMEAQKLSELGRYDEAKEIYSCLWPYSKKTAPFFADSLSCEYMFLELITSCNHELIDRLYDSGAQKFLKATAKTPSACRILYAYERYYNGSMEKAEKYAAAFEKNLSHTQFEAEKSYEKELFTAALHKNSL